MRPYAFLLYPFAVLYDLITWVRNRFFDWGWLKSKNPSITSVLVGNLSVGGTGKTPMVEHLIRLTQDRLKVATLSRGYGRKTSGFLKAEMGIKPSDIGDEPFQIFQKFSQSISVFVGEKRVEAMEKIASDFPETELVILDDAFQHRYLKADFNILLTTFDRPFFKDFLLPMGRLRESRIGAKRADLVVVTKCPQQLSKEEKAKITEQIKNYTKPLTPILFSAIGYGEIYPIKNQKMESKNVILLSGIANDSHLKSHVSQNFKLLETLKYPDHHEYGGEDFKKIQEVFSKYSAQKPVLVTTEKDAVKVKSNAPEGFLAEIPIFVLPIEVIFSPEDAQLLASLIDQVILQKK